MNRKRIISLLLALVMLLAASVISVSAEGSQLGDKAVTLTISPDKNTVCVGAQPVYVTFDIKLKSNDGTTPIPAFSFKLDPTSGMVLADKNKGGAAQTSEPDYYYWLNLDQWKTDEENDKLAYNVFEYTPSPNRYFGGAGTEPGKGITAESQIMTIAAKFPANTTAGTYTLNVVNDSFIAGSGKTYVNIADQFGTRTVVPGSVTVKAGVEISGTLKDDVGTAVANSGGTVKLYQGTTEVGTGTLNTNGTYSFTNVSTGTYTVKASDVQVGEKKLSGSLNVTVTDGALTAQNVTVQQWAKGDVNHDTKVNINDVVRLLNHVNKSNVLTDTYGCDFTGDGKVNINDVIRLLNHVNKSNPF